jgi:hypothetical protein
VSLLLLLLLLLLLFFFQLLFFAVVVVVVVVVQRLLGSNDVSQSHRKGDQNFPNLRQLLLFSRWVAGEPKRVPEPGHCDTKWGKMRLLLESIT